MTYLNTGTFTVYIIPSAWRWIKEKLKHRGSVTTHTNYPYNIRVQSLTEQEGLLSPAHSQHSLQDLEAASAALQKKTSGSKGQNTPELPKFTVAQTAKLASQFCFLWYCANLFSNASLSYTSVGSSTLLTSTSSIFTLILGSIFKVEKFSFKKLGALGISILGIALINREESISTSNSVNGGNPDNPQGLAWLGNSMALVSALLYGFYTTLLKVRVGDDDERINMFHFFGFVGLFTLLLLWPMIVIFNYCGVEKFELPPTEYVWVIVLINAASTIISDFCWAMSMLLTSPLVVTVGLSATIPLALAGDMILKSHFGTWLYYVGALLMCLSFFFINRQETVDHEDSPSEPDPH